MIMNTSKPKFRSATSPPFYSNSPDVKFSKMPRRSFLKPTLLLIFVSLFAICFIYFSSTHNPPYSLFSPGRNSPELRLSSGGGVPKVRIYMYDLPRKFTYGVIESYEKARGAISSGRKDDSLFKYPGHQHSAEWHLFQHLNQLSNELVDSFVTRVDDPEEADLFYVPFFSSLSLVVNNNRPGSLDVTSYSDEEMQESLIEWLEKQVYWKRNNGWDHVFICQDPNALYKVIDRIKNGVLLVSDFGRLSRNQASLVKDIILPYSHRINTYEGDIGVENRDKLLFFMGNRYRKEGGKIRDLLFQVLENEKDVVIKHGAQSRESRREARHGMHTSRFCLHPAGDTPSACRLFDAILSLCIPVVVSDYIELPFEDAIDYRKIAIFVDTSTAVKKGHLVKLLRQVTPNTIVRFQHELRKVKHYFEYEDPNGTVKEIWREVSQKLPLIKLMINRDKRLVIREDISDEKLDCSCLCSNQSGVHTIMG